jgi:transposase
VLSILAGEVTVAEAARRAKVSEQSVGNWKRQFLEGVSDRLCKCVT